MKSLCNILFKVDVQLAIGVLKLLIGSFYENVKLKHGITGQPINVPVYVNPTPEDTREIKKIAFPKNISPYVRFLADKNQQKVYVWHGEFRRLP
jgi:hypothetical protein